MKTFLITGTSTGFGKALAEEVIEAGYNLIATARDKSRIQHLAEGAPGRVLTATLEVTKQSDIDELIKQAVTTFGRIDVLVNNAGYGLQGAIEEASDEEVRHQFDVNVFGLLSVTRAVLPVMRAQGSGHILNISSQAGFVSTPGLGIYAASKFAVEAISEALAAELKPRGIKVTSIQPGPFRTDWAGGNMVRTAARMEVYSDTSGALDRMFYDLNGRQPGDPAKAAKAMLRIINEEQPPMRLPLGKIAVERIRGKLKTVDEELGKWEELSNNTDFNSGNSANS